MVTGSGEKARTSRFGDQDGVSVSIGGPDRLFLFDKLAVFDAADADVNFASVPILALPRADFILVGGYFHLDALKNGAASAQIIDAFVLTYALGTVATIDNDVADAGEFNLRTAQILAAATAGVAPHDKGVLQGTVPMAMNPANSYIDNNAGTLAVFLNMTLPDASIGVGVNRTLRVKGSLRLVTIGLGKNA
jgi:hypothetical protein